MQTPGEVAAMLRLNALVGVCGVPGRQILGRGRLMAEGDYVVGRWEGGGTHTGPASSDFLIGPGPRASCREIGSPGQPYAV